MGSCRQSCEKSKVASDSARTAPASVLAWLCLLPIRFYRYFISPMLGPKCRFEPTCSCYAEEAIRSHGAIYGLALALKRLAKCHPWHPGGYDPVPKKHRC